MTKEEINVLGYEDLEKRTAEIATETAEADAEKLAALNEELDAITERREALDLEVETRKKAADAVALGAGTTIKEKVEEKKTMTRDELRNSREYLAAYANYVKTGEEMEVRTLLTENGLDGDNNPGTIPVPSVVDSRIRAAWENDKVMTRVSKSFIPGNYKVAFEYGATGADWHAEGADALDEEKLDIGTVTLVPAMAKKWITATDEALAIGPADFLAYLYDEIEYKIVQYLADMVVEAIQDAPTTSDATRVGVPVIDGPVSAENILLALGMLGDNARNKVVIASGETIANVRIAALHANYAYDPFAGLVVIQKSGVEGAIVGDLAGVHVNMPEGDGVKFKFDDLSLAEKDLVKIVGRLYAGIGVVEPGMFVNITGEEESESGK